MIRATCRCRVDLAGGTLDIWPLGLLHKGSTTVNVAVELPVSASLNSAESGYLVVQGRSRRFASSAGELAAHPETALVGLVAEELDLPPVEVEIASASPNGAGLGASSALTVALLAAGEQLLHGRLVESTAARSAIARDLEARLMGLPTGLQDHFPAQLGGVVVLEHRPGGERLRRLAVDLEALGERLLVAFTGESHFSAANNWQVVRGRLDGDPELTRRLDAIRDAAAELAPALEAGEWDAVGAAMGREWEARRGLAPEVSSTAIERLLSLAAELGGWGGKACGAGGGGCVAVLAPPERRAAIADAWIGAGAELLPARPTELGLEISSLSR